MMKHVNSKEIYFRKKGNRTVRNWLGRRRSLSQFLLDLLISLKSHKAGLYLVGGMVRDILEGVKEINDIDMMVCGIDFDDLGKVLKSLNRIKLGIKSVIQAGKHFPVYRVFVKWKSDPLDIACARAEESTGAGHKDFKISTDSVSAYEDSGRRDFTFNSIFVRLFTSFNSLTGRLVDYRKGLIALRERNIEAVGNPKLRFEEDPLRMLRAIRQKNQRSGFSINKQTWNALIDLMPKLLHTISDERVSAELIKSFKADLLGSFTDLAECGALKLLLPELFEERRFDTTLKKFIILKNETGLSVEFSLACLLSEIAFTQPEDISTIIRRLCLPNQSSLMTFLLSLISLVNIDTVEYKFAIVEELLMDVSSVEEIILLYGIHKEVHGEKIINLPEIWNLIKSVPKLVNGNDLSKAGISPGPDMKNILRYLRDKQLQNKIFDKEELMKLVAVERSL